MTLWLTGQVESARQMLQLLQSDLFRPPGTLFPELALYDCHSCHHPFEQTRWTPQRTTAGTKPGTLRLQTQNLVVLQAALQSLEPAALAELSSLTAALVRAGQRDPETVRTAAGAVLQYLDKLEILRRKQFSRDE